MDAISSSPVRFRSPGPALSSLDLDKRRPIAALRLLFAVQLVVFAIVVWKIAITTPYLDMLTWQHDALIALRTNTVSGWWAHLLHPHNEHRLALVRLMTLFDLTLGGGNQLIFIVVTLFAVLMMAWGLWRVMADNARRQDRALALIVPMLVLSSTAALDVGLPINCVYPLSLAFLVGALVLFSGAIVAPASATRLFIGAIICASLAPYGNMTGLAVWPVLLWLGLRGRLAPALLLCVLLIGGAESLLYLWNNMPGSHASASGLSAGHAASSLARIVAYAGIFLGLPFSRIPALAVPSMVLGLGLAGVTIALLLRDCVTRAPSTRASLVSTGLLLTGIGVACMAALGRANEEEALIAPARYALYVLLLYAGLVMRFLLWLRRHPLSGRMTDLRIGLGFASLLVLFQGVSGFAGFRAADTLRKSVQSWHPGQHDECYLKTIFPDLGYADRVRRDVDAYLLER
ncbi:hypothetical protein [Asaia krungthepensis]|uniref:Transmembrane protein n=1 Tax=Asaia krungthepensis NRIC 0535 TaxID=1307925 RepID=A0ABQ0Q0K3_9PROT|nr:hypothetical protein [Asaia krungthepensis]GBQ86228.1 hypothetical protein AA0535_0967 [Asaia krungthepensis NRIC 0535]